MRRRRALTAAAAWPLVSAPALAGAENPSMPGLAGWVAAAHEMRHRALAAGDQPYGAVLVLDGRIVGEGPSRVVVDRDPDAHAERVAIRDAQARLGRARLEGSVLVSTSRPCAACERAAHAAGVARMRHGPVGADAGAPQP